MAILREAATRSGTRSLSAVAEIQAGAEKAFALICEVPKWPVWLGFLRSAQIVGSPPLQLGSEVLLRSSVPGEAEQLFEVERYVTNHTLCLVGAYSIRRRLEFRIERKTTRCKVQALLEYPAYGGKVAMAYDALHCARRLSTALEAGLVHFKHLAEYDASAKDELLADF